MTQAIAHIEDRTLLQIQVIPQDKLQLLKDTICRGATDDELALFVEVCNRKRLDPFAKQIHAVKRWDNQLKREAMSMQTGIDGFRLIAERTGKYEGQTAPQWCGTNGKWVDVWTANVPPEAARVGVYRTGFREPLIGVARYKSYVQTTKDGGPNNMWRKMDDHMLAKCAEALALRKAFPEELSGLYTSDEMGSANEAAAEEKARYEESHQSPVVVDAKLEARAKPVAPKLKAPELPAVTEEDIAHYTLAISMAGSEENLASVYGQIMNHERDSNRDSLSAPFNAKRKEILAAKADAAMDAPAPKAVVLPTPVEEAPWAKHLDNNEQVKNGNLYRE